MAERHCQHTQSHTVLTNNKHAVARAYSQRFELLCRRTSGFI
jgi:hypothetical protein